MANTVTFHSSDFEISGTQTAYRSEGFVVSNVTVNGISTFRYAPQAVRNVFKVFDADGYTGGIDVRENSVLHFGFAATPFVKRGAGTLVVEESAAIQKLTLEAGTLKIPSNSGTLESIQLRPGTRIDISEPRAMMQVSGEVALDAGESIILDVTGRSFDAEERDPRIGGIPVIRWGTMPEGTVIVKGGQRGCRFHKTETAGVLRWDGTMILLR